MTLLPYRPPATRYGVALLSATAAVLARWLLQPLLGASAPLFILISAVAVTVWFEGLGPALLAALVGFLASGPLFLWPGQTAPWHDPRNVIMAVTYFGTVAIVVSFGVVAREAQRKQIAEARRTSEDLLKQELADTELLRDVGAELVREQNVDRLYDKILGAAVAIMRSDFASMQMMVPGEDGPRLQLLAYRGFTPEAARFWRIVGPSSAATCGVALRLGKRVVVSDVTASPIVGDEDRATYAQTGIMAVQTTPLLSREGPIVGMISTHWRLPHEPSERDLRLMDILARQAADLIERVRAIDRLQENARLLDLSNDAILVRDEKDRIIYWNHGAEEIYGYRSEQALGRVSHDLLQTEHPDSIERILELLRRDGRWSGELTHRRSDGSRVIVASRWAIDRDAHGGLAAILETNTDITEEKAAAEALRRRTAQHETLLQQAPLGVFLVDADFTIREVNPVALPVFEEIPGGVIGKRVEDVADRMMGPEQSGEIVRIFRHTLETGEPYHVPEYEVARADRGVAETYEWRLDRIMFPDGRYGLVCYFLDISKQVTTRRTIQESDRRKDEFLAVLAHELRNPLGPVRNAAHYLKLRNLPDRELRRPIEMIERQVTHMARLLDDLLDVSRIARGALELRPERVALSDIVDAAVESSSDEIEGRGHSFQVKLPAAPVTLEADRHRLVQVFGNLISNAAKYTPAGGRIEVEAEVEGDHLRVSVRDNGVGIPPSKLSEIFELFARVDQSLERQGGLGIGLTLARQLIELHGGRIEAISEGIGYGSTFVVTLPIALERRPEETTAVPESRRVKPRRVLVADDNVDAAESLGLLLEMDRHMVRLALDGEDALRLAGEFQPEVAFLDIGMPKLNGYEVARRIRGESWGRSMRLIALTGWGQQQDRRRAEEAGFDAHLVKPVSPATLVEYLGEGVDEKSEPA